MLTHIATYDQPQKDGRRMVSHKFIDHLGNSHFVGPNLVSANYDANLGMLERLVSLEASLADAEMAERARVDKLRQINTLVDSNG